jgi:hypothetical protein
VGSAEKGREDGQQQEMEEGPHREKGWRCRGPQRRSVRMSSGKRRWFFSPLQSSRQWQRLGPKPAREGDR